MSNSQDEQFLRLALNETQHCIASRDVPVGAAVVREGKLIATGFNKREADHDPTAHAEIIALKNAGSAIGSWNLSNCTLYVSLEPCPMCAAAAIQARIKKIIYSTPDPKGGAISLGIDLLQNKKLNHQVEFEQGPLGEEASALLKEFFQKIREQKKKQK